MEYNFIHTSKCLQDIREKMAMTQSQMAEALDISLTHYAQIEQGGHKMSLDLLFKMMTFCQVDANTLLLDNACTDSSREMKVFNRIENLNAKEKEGILICIETMLNSMCDSDMRQVS